MLEIEFSIKKIDPCALYEGLKQWEHSQNIRTVQIADHPLKTKKIIGTEVACTCSQHLCQGKKDKHAGQGSMKEKQRPFGSLCLRELPNPINNYN